MKLKFRCYEFGKKKTVFSLLITMFVKSVTWPSWRNHWSTYLSKSIPNLSLISCHVGNLYIAHLVTSNRNLRMRTSFSIENYSKEMSKIFLLELWWEFQSLSNKFQAVLKRKTKWRLNFHELECTPFFLWRMSNPHFIAAFYRSHPSSHPLLKKGGSYMPYKINDVLFFAIFSLGN